MYRIECLSAPPRRWFWQEQSLHRLLSSLRSNYQNGVQACRELESLRSHLWRHSHSGPVRWRKGAAAEEGAEAQAVLAAEQVEQPEPQATQAATALLNLPAAKAVQVAIALLNPPAARAGIALIPRDRSWVGEHRWRHERTERPCRTTIGSSKPAAGQNMHYMELRTCFEMGATARWAAQRIPPMNRSGSPGRHHPTTGDPIFRRHETRGTFQ
jgi:hypothetical protein